MTIRSAGTPRSLRNACCARPLRVSGTEWVVIVTPVRAWAAAAAVMTRTTSGVKPAGAGHDLDHAGPDRRSRRSPPRCRGRTSRRADRARRSRRRAMELEVERKHVRGVVAGGGDQVQRDPLGDRRDQRDRATEAGDGQVDHRADPAACSAVSSRTARSVASPWSKVRPGNDALQLEVADEDVLVDERRPEVGPVHRAAERRDRAHPGLSREARCRPRRAGPRSTVPDASACAVAGTAELRPDRLGVGAERARQGGNATRRPRQLRGDARDEQGSVESVVLHRHDHLAGEELGVGGDVGDAVDPTDRDLALAQQRDDLAGRPGRSSSRRSPSPARLLVARDPCWSPGPGRRRSPRGRSPGTAPGTGGSCSRRCTPTRRPRTRTRSSAPSCGRCCRSARGSSRGSRTRG